MSTKTTTMTTNPPPPGIPEIKLSYPTPSILLITINRPKDLNCMNSTMNHYLHALYTWYDAQPSLLCAILTGTGRAFCAGADLKEWNASHEKPPSTNTDTNTDTNTHINTNTNIHTNTDTNTSAALSSMPPSGFGGLSRRSGKKPVICAVNGLCLGGGCEMVINADMVVADRQRAVFGLPEVKIGVVALAGALTRLTRTVGRQRAMEMALTGRALSADEARDWGLVNRVVDGGEVVAEAVRLAEGVCANSPDSVIVSREGVKLGWEGVGAEEGTRQLMELWYGRIDKGENMKEGVRSFVEKRKPKWVASKL